MHQSDKKHINKVTIIRIYIDKFNNMCPVREFEKDARCRTFDMQQKICLDGATINAKSFEEIQFVTGVFFWGFQ